MESLAVICLPSVFSVTALFLCELSHCLAVCVTFHPNRAGGDGGLFSTNASVALDIFFFFYFFCIVFRLFLYIFGFLRYFLVLLW